MREWRERELPLIERIRCSTYFRSKSGSYIDQLAGWLASHADDTIVLIVLISSQGGLPATASAPPEAMCGMRWSSAKTARSTQHRSRGRKAETRMLRCMP